MSDDSLSNINKFTKALYGKEFDFNKISEIFINEELPEFINGKNYMILAENDSDFFTFFVEVSQTGSCLLIVVYDEISVNRFPNGQVLKELLLNIKTGEDFTRIYNTKPQKYFNGNSQFGYSYCEV